MTVIRKITIGEFYHVYNRGVERRVVFPTKEYYRRFIDALSLFNTTLPITIRDFHTGIRSLNKGERLVDVGAFILLPTHFHLLLRPKIDNGLSLFMQKIGAGYTGYFNLKNNRNGVLFQGKYKVKHLNRDNYARYLLAYIPLNALDNSQPNWREDGIKDIKMAKEILTAYPWSSFSSYTYENKFPGIINQDFIKNFFDHPFDYERFILSRSQEIVSYVDE